METPKQLFNARVRTSLGHRHTVLEGIRDEVADPNRAVGSASELSTWTGIGLPCLRLRGWIETHDG